MIVTVSIKTNKANKGSIVHVDHGRKTLTVVLLQSIVGRGSVETAIKFIMNKKIKKNSI